MAQQHLRNVLAYLDVPTLGQPEGFIHAKEGLFDAAGGIGPDSKKFLQGWLDHYVAWVKKHGVTRANLPGTSPKRQRITEMKTRTLPTYFISHGGGPWPWMKDQMGRHLRPSLRHALRDMAAPVGLDAQRVVLMISGHWGGGRVHRHVRIPTRR